MMKLRSKRFSRSSSKLRPGGATHGDGEGCKSCGMLTSEIKWELRPGGMLVQKRECKESAGEGVITIRISTVSQWHDISVQATSTFGKQTGEQDFNFFILNMTLMFHYSSI